MSAVLRASIQADSCIGFFTVADAQAIPVLVQTLKEDKGEFVRFNAARALGRLKSEEAVKPLQEALKAEERELVRATAALALGRLRDSSARASLAVINS